MYHVWLKKLIRISVTAAPMLICISVTAAPTGMFLINNINKVMWAQITHTDNCVQLTNTMDEICSWEPNSYKARHKNNLFYGYEVSLWSSTLQLPFSKANEFGPYPHFHITLQRDLLTSNSPTSTLHAFTALPCALYIPLISYSFIWYANHI